MFRLKQLPTRLSTVVIYAVVIAAAAVIASSRIERAASAEGDATPEDAPVNETTTVEVKPFFALSTNRTFATNESPRLWLDHRGFESLDFRVYRINDPQRFFTQLSDPHQMGEFEREQMAARISSRPSLLERLRTVKLWAYLSIRDYFRGQLKQNTRVTFNQKFRATDTNGIRRVPLNQADYASVPLLNPNQLVTSWREPLPAGNSYDRRLVPLGKRESGVYLVEAIGGDRRAYTIVVVTDLAMVEKTSPGGDLLVYAVDRKTGAPRPDSQVEIVKARNTIASGRTNGEGMFRARVSPDGEDADPEPEGGANGVMIFASQGENFAISDLESFYFGDFAEQGNLQGYIYTDRPIYRPNHTVYFKGIIRAVDDQDQYGPSKSRTVTVTIKDSNDARVFEQELRLSRHGTFNGEFTLAEEAPLGSYNIQAETEEGSSGGMFEVGEYKKPEYKVTVTTPKRFVTAGNQTKFDIDARYFFGAPLAGAEVQYYIYRSRYYPYFNEEVEASEEDEEEYSGSNDYYGDLVADDSGKLDASGHLTVDFPVPPGKDDDVWDFQYRIQAQVTDSSRRSMDGSATVIATRGNVIARAAPTRYVYTSGQTAKIDVETTDYQGRPVAAKILLKFLSRNWVKVEQKEDPYDPDYKMVETELSSGEVTTNQEGHGSYNFVATTGSIIIKTVVHESGKQYVSLGGYIWVVGSDQPWSDLAYYRENFGSIKLVPDKKSYRAGETAHVLAILPKDNANLLVTTERSSVMWARQIKATEQTVLIDVPIEAKYAPNVFLSVTFVQNGDMYTSDQRLVVPARDKLLNLEVISNKEEYKPRETASYTILARDADGAPVPDAEVSLGVVDEAIYNVSPDFTGNIRQEFYGMHFNSVDTHLSIAYSFIGFAGEKPMDLASTKPSYQLADFKNEGEMVQPLIRKQFKDTAFWEPTAITGKDGRATVKFRLPDNLTTWRATARAVTADTRVGVAKHKVISRKDVILRLEAPRFLTQGDTVTLSGIVHNYLKHDKTTQISISVSGARLLSPAQQTVTIQKQGDHRIDWQVSAPQTGEIRLLAKALTNTESDAVEMTLDVVPRGLHESKAENWTTTDDNALQEFSLDLPANTDPNSRKLRLEVSPSVAGTLFGPLDYLTTYPYGCTEQTMSSFLPNIVVSQTLKEFKTTSIRNPDELKKKVERGRDRLYGFQHEDGGWGWWKDDASDPFMTAYVINGLTLAKQAGYEIDDGRLARGRYQLNNMLETGTFRDADTRAFMVYALTESGGADSQHIEKLFKERNNLQPYGRALLALTLSLVKDQRASDLATDIERSAAVDKFTAHWESQRSPLLDFSEHDEIEGTALSLKALTRIKPDSQLLPLAARWLVANRHEGWFWNSTKDTAFAIYGLIDYVRISHELTPSYDLEVYLNGENVLTQHVDEGSAVQTLSVVRKGGIVGESNRIRVVKRGAGALYFSTSVDYYTNEENVSARGSADLTVSREYLRLRVESVNYNLKWSTSPLTGEIKSGELIVVRLRLTGKKARHLMLEDPIPSGAEQLQRVGYLNLDHANTGWSDWYSAREFRDRRTVFFLDSFDGDATFQYAMRVQVPGEFIVAPARAELMYEPATNANSASNRFSFLDRSVEKR